MSLRPFILSLSISVLMLGQAGAQDRTPFFRRTLEKLLAPSMGLDPDAVYQPAPRWSFALTGDFRQAVISQQNSADVDVYSAEEGKDPVMMTLPVSASSCLRGGVQKTVGIQAGYGNLALSLRKKIGKGGENSTFSFDFLGAGYAMQVQYFKYSQPVDYDFRLGDEAIGHYFHEEGVTMNPGNMRALILDAMYSFNRRTFVYCGAYKDNKFQRRNAGSFMLGSKLILGEYKLDPHEEIVLWTGGQARQTTAQISFGGGYSYNFVPLHRQPHGDREKGLRNLTINVTALPMVTLFNQFTSTLYQLDAQADEDFVFVPAHKTHMNGKLKVNYIVRAGIGYSHDLITLNLSASVDSFAYRGRTTMPYAETSFTDVDFSGEFSRWTVGLRIGKRF